VTKLSLRRNQFGNDGAVAMADALASNTSLIKLNLCDNSIDDKGGTTLLRALRIYNDTLLELDLILNLGVSTSLREVIDGMLATRRVLRWLLNHWHKPLEERVIPYAIRTIHQNHLYHTSRGLKHRRKTGLIRELAFREHCPRAADFAGFIYHLVRTAPSKKSLGKRAVVEPQHHSIHLQLQL
jgi:hypothetical protein